MKEVKEDTHIGRVLELARREGAIRSRDLDAIGAPREYLNRMLKRGLLKRVSRGIYMLADADVTENHTLAEVSKRIPKGVVCLLSALQFHDLTTQQPHKVWLAIDAKAWRPQVDYPPIQIVHFSGPAFTEGIEEHDIEGVNVRVYGLAKTVADCFKYRNKIGLDVAVEALRDCRRQHKCSNDELWRYAKICRVSNVMRPYLEAVS